MRWYVVRIATGSEKRVIAALQAAIVEQQMQDSFGQMLVPTEEVVEVKDGKRRKSQRRFFPGYMLLQMEYSVDAWYLVKGIPKVMSFVGGTKERPLPISEAEAQAMLDSMKQGSDKPPKSKMLFEAGEMVRIIDGPFADFNGVVEEANHEKQRLKVSVLIFGRSTPVELEFGQVEKVS